MSPLRSNECVLDSETLEEAIHKLIMGKGHSLLVRSEERIAGILRLSDVSQQLTWRRANPNASRMQTNKLGD